MIDYHVHPGYSLDAIGSILDYCQKAKEIGIEEICFTPHLELDPFRNEEIEIRGRMVSARSDWLDVYFEDLDTAIRKFPELRIKKGVEIGYAPGIDEEIADVTSKYPFDFVLGAIHSLDHTAISSRVEAEKYYTGRSPAEVCRKYFALLETVIESNLFDCVAHFDVYKKYGVKYYGNDLILEAEPFIEPMLKLVKNNGILIEINTSGLRKPSNEIFPSLQILKRLRELGCKSVTIGSDAHTVTDLGKGIKEASLLAKNLGFNIARFEKRVLIK
jgi:histidinol-phosphatase (PHP family)